MEQWQIELENKINLRFERQDKYIADRMTEQDVVLNRIDQKLDKLSVIATVVRWLVGMAIACWVGLHGATK